MHVLVLLLLYLPARLAQNATCDMYNDNGGALNITETQSTPQLVVEDRARTLYCNAINYCQIDWYRDGIPRDGFQYLWNFTSDNQQIKMQLEDNNQTLDFTKVLCEAAGHWTCVVSGETQVLNRTIEISVTGPTYTASPVFRSNDNNCLNKTAKIGEKVSLYCPCTAEENTPDVQLEWYKWEEPRSVVDEDGGTGGEWIPILELGENGTTYTVTQPYLDMDPHCAKSGKTPTISQYLIINELSENEYGMYRVVATRNDDSEYRGLNATQIIHITKPPPPRTILDNPIFVIAISIAVSVSGVIILASVAGLIWWQKGLDIKLIWKDRYGKTESGDGKKYDAYIAYSESDTDLKFVMETLMPALQKADYVPFIKDIDTIPGGTLVEELISSLESSRRCIIVISPDFIKAKHAALQVEVATDQMLRHESKIIPLTFKSVKNQDIKRLRGLQRISDTLRGFKWDDSEGASNDKVIKQLLLRMPPVRRSGRLNSDLPLSSRMQIGDQSPHGSQQCLVPNEGSTTPATIDVALPSTQTMDYQPHAVAV